MFKIIKNNYSFITCLLIVSLLSFNLLKTTKAYSKKHFYITNMAIPAILGGIKAYYEGNPVEKAILQGALGGLIMQEGLKGIADAENHSTASAWKNKLIFNYGASLAESAGEDKIVYRMDIGPLWLTYQDNNKIKTQLGVASTLVTCSHLINKSKFDAKNSLKYGTVAFKRACSSDGTLRGSSALAYSNANIIATNFNGEHAGHELTHTFQYRRNMISPLKVTNLVPTVERNLHDIWFDDSAWAINWGLQCAWADIRHKDKSFDIPLEREAYWLEEKYKSTP